ncbi:MAG: helix-hairpin-helix domain-containing protein [Pseudomonadota bacterium]
MTLFDRYRSLLAATTLCLVAPVAFAGPVNINTADAQTLAAELEGVGITKARAIVAYRNANGRFRDAQALTAVTGIGERTVSLNAKNIRVEDAKAKPAAPAKKPAK